MKNKILLLALLIVMILPIVNANNMTFHYDSQQQFIPMQKVYWLIELPDGSNNINYSCISYVEKNGELLQVNPDYIKKNDNIISWLFPIVEQDEFFHNNKGVVNVYYTDKNLYIEGDTNFTFGVECSHESGTIIGERTVTPRYKDLNFATSRFVWFKDNIPFILLFILMFLLIITVFWAIWRKDK